MNANLFAQLNAQDSVSAFAKMSPLEHREAQDYFDRWNASMDAASEIRPMCGTCLGNHKTEECSVPNSEEVLEAIGFDF